MTESKQKAQQLVDKMNGYTHTDCVQNAIICVEEIIKETTGMVDEDSGYSSGTYWQEVLTHLKEKL